MKQQVIFDLTQPSAASSRRKPASAGTSCDSCCGQDNKSKATLFQRVLQDGHFVITLVNFWLQEGIKVICNFPATVDCSVKKCFQWIMQFTVSFCFIYVTISKLIQVSAIYWSFVHLLQTYCTLHATLLAADNTLFMNVLPTPSWL